ncbi:magnesium transporter CorA family protein, partial [bacterium]|nr:magnesium transporter CorA family protein [bacterium]
DVIVDNKQAIEMANIYSNILSGMMDAFASVISNNLSVVMKFLASVAIVLMLPTLVASIYGMNVEVPFKDSPYAFLIAMVASIVLAAISVAIFRRRRWF